MVAGTLWGSVVARMKTTCGGGSSRVFRQGVEGLLGEHVHLVDDIDLVLAAWAGRYLIFSRRSRISSMPRLLAPSISMTSSQRRF